jgi:glycosyltransferase involved in cell wall biosynthesis
MSVGASVNLVISTLGAGGAERVLTTMAAWWAGRGVAVQVLTLASAQAQSFYELHPAVQVQGLGVLAESRGVLQGLANNIVRVRRLRDAIRQFAHGPVISFGTETNCLVLLAGMGLGKRLIVSERCDPRYIPQRRLWRLARRLLYPFASAVVVQSRDAACFFDLGRPPVVVPNPVPALSVDEETSGHGSAAESIPAPFVAAMGRLTAQKGFDLLIKAFAAVATNHPAWSLVILGEGPSRRSLETMLEREGLVGRVFLPGLITAPARVLARSELFVLSSRFEGFPNALCEAMCCGLPVIATDCPSGPRDIVRPGVDGYLTPCDDVHALATALDTLMGDPERRRELAARAKEVVSRFSLDNIMARWDAVIDGAGAQEHGGKRA